MGSLTLDGALVQVRTPSGAVPSSGSAGVSGPLSSSPPPSSHWMSTRAPRRIAAAGIDRNSSSGDNSPACATISSSDDNLSDMPPLQPLDDDVIDFDTQQATRAPANEEADVNDALLSKQGGAASPPAATDTVPISWCAFGDASSRCTPGYGCCLRYGLSLGPCCLPRGLATLPGYPWLQERFYPLHADEATLRFLHGCEVNFFMGGWLSWWGIRVALLKPLLRRCMAHTDVNGLLRCGQMFLASTAQLRILLQQSIPAAIRGGAGIEWPWSDPAASLRRTRLLDVGAGDGHITAQLASLGFDDVVTTEVAAHMVPRLRARGWACAHTGDLDEGLPVGGDLCGSDGFDCVALFNVLDRCNRPRTLLRQILARMRAPSSDGHNRSRLILSVPLPLDPSVESGTTWRDPAERILAPGMRRTTRDFESAALALADWLMEQGFNIESLSRIPYLSQGDTRRPFYVLDCSLWVLSKRLPNEPVPKALPAKASAAAATQHHAAHAAHSEPSSVLANLTAEVD